MLLVNVTLNVLEVLFVYVYGSITNVDDVVNLCGDIGACLPACIILFRNCVAARNGYYVCCAFQRHECDDVYVACGRYGQYAIGDAEGVGKRTAHPHTLQTSNFSMRTLTMAIVETHHTGNGTIELPEVLWSYGTRSIPTNVYFDDDLE